MMCYDADLHKMQLTSAEKKYLRLFRSSLAIFPSINLVIFCCSRAQSPVVQSNGNDPGCIVTHRRVVSTSRETPSLDRDSTHFSLGSKKHSPAFCKCSSEQLPHLHLYKNIKTVVSRGIVDTEHRSLDRSYTIAVR